jgi:curved DNA-binding protein
VNSDEFMIYKDYYKDLGIGKNATTAEIKKAYRTLANKYHPDKTRGDKASEEKFKDINEANEVLRNPLKRKKYDQFGADWKHYEEAGTQPGGFDWSKYSNDRGNQSHRTNTRDPNTVFTDEGVNDFFEMLFGKQSDQSQARRNIVVKGGDLETETTLSLEEVYNGTTRLVKLNDQTIKVSIKPGIAEKQRLRIASKGAAGLNGGANGDLYLNIKIAHHRDFIRNGNDLHCSIPVELYTALLGGKTRIKTLKGSVTINIPKETQNGKELRLRDLGMPIYLKKNEFGNLLVKINVELPQNLTAEETALFGKLASLRN